MLGIAVALIALSNAVHSAEKREQRFQLTLDKGPLASVLDQVVRQTGWSIITELGVSESETDELGPFAGVATIDEAMRELLKGTDLSHSWIDEDTIAIGLSGYREWSLPGRTTIKEVSDRLRPLPGNFDPGSCGDLAVGPVFPGRKLAARDFWALVIAPHCPVVYRRTGDAEPGSIDRLTVAGETEHHFSIGEMSRFTAFQRISQQAGGLTLGYLSSHSEEENADVGPIRGQMSLNEALELAMRDSVLRVRWVEDDLASIEPAHRIVAYADMSKCPCNFGLPELRPVQSGHVTVTESRLPSLEPHVPGQVVTFGRKQIEATGVSNIPDFLRYATQLPYMRSRGFRLSGAQFAELRGLEPQYTLILINGTRADVSASDLMVSAFDLNNVPISAVERIEVSAGSPSLVHGMDAIGGVVNIILRDDVTAPYAEVRYGSASGGARERIGTVAVGSSTDRAKTAFFFDYFEASDLLGEKRERWRDMDYTRFGGPDRRSRFASPPNIYTLDGSNLPGLDAPEAAVSILPSGEIALRPGEANVASPLALQAIVPAMKRASLSGFGEMDLGRSKLSGEVLFVHRRAHFQMDADISPGYVMDANHPQNPFHVPVAVDAALIGLPPRATDSRSELLRGVIRLDGPIGAWRYHSFVRFSQEEASAAQLNFVDAAAVMSGLASTDSTALNLISDRPGELAGASLLAPRHNRNAESGGAHISARVNGPLPVFRADATLGVEYRKETARFDAHVGRLERLAAATFGTLKIPIGEHIDVSYGARIDGFSSFERIRREQFGLSWKPTSGLEFRAAYNEAFHIPSFFDLYLPRGTSPALMFDPRRQELSTVDFIFGGNPDLSPTSGASTTLGIAFNDDDFLRATVDLWRIRMRNHVAPVSPFALLANESTAIAGRIVRDEPTVLDNQAGRPGRLMALDVSRANIGEIDARGVDVSIQQEIPTAVGTFIPRIDLTYIHSHLFSDLPSTNAAMRDRAGIASALGTIPSWRGTGSLTYSGYDWAFNVFGRFHSSYSDYDTVTGVKSNRDIPFGALWDLTLSKKIGAYIKLTIGASDVLDQAPPFAVVNDPVGFDVSQADLTGRTAFIQVNGSM